MAGYSYSKTATPRDFDDSKDKSADFNAIIHGDPDLSNIRITPARRVGLLDWAEARRDIPDLDLANLDIAILDGHRRHF